MCLSKTWVVIVSVLASGSWVRVAPVKSKTGIGICYISSKHAALLNQALMCQSGGTCLPVDCVIFQWGRIYKFVKYNRITMSQNNIKKHPFILWKTTWPNCTDEIILLSTTRSQIGWTSTCIYDDTWFMYYM
jgi:hypothetical protein